MGSENIFRRLTKHRKIMKMKSFSWKMTCTENIFQGKIFTPNQTDPNLFVRFVIKKKVSVAENFLVFKKKRKKWIKIWILRFLLIQLTSMLWLNDDIPFNLLNNPSTVLNSSNLWNYENEMRLHDDSWRNWLKL